MRTHKKDEGSCFRLRKSFRSFMSVTYSSPASINSLVSSTVLATLQVNWSILRFYDVCINICAVNGFVPQNPLICRMSFALRCFIVPLKCRRVLGFILIKRRGSSVSQLSSNLFFRLSQNAKFIKFSSLILRPVDSNIWLADSSRCSVLFQDSCQR